MDIYKKKYEGLKVLGEGGFAKVYLARERKSNKLFAAKVFDKTRSNLNPMDELRAFSTLRSHPHPNIVGCYDSFEDPCTLVMIYEYLPNGDLMSYLANRQPSEEEVKKIFYGLLQGVKHLHALGIVHRDIKLENICFGKGWVPKLIDFNLSCGWSTGNSLQDYCGSIYYCAPELFLRKPYKGPEVDVWALGVVLYSLLFARFPFNLNGAELWTTDKDGKAVTLSEEAKNREIALKVVHGKYTLEDSNGCVSEAPKTLLSSIFQKDVRHRTTIKQMEEHFWLHDLKKEAGERQRSKSMETKEKTFSELFMEKLLKFNTCQKLFMGKQKLKSCGSEKLTSICTTLSGLVGIQV